MTTLDSHTVIPEHSTRPSARPRTALAVVGGVLAVNAALLAPQLFLSSDAYSQIAGTTLHLVHYAVWTACLIVLSQLYPLLGGLRGRNGRALSSTVLRLAAVGAGLAACAQFVATFVNPYLAEHDPALLDSTPDPILLVPLLVTTAFAGLATAGFGLAAGLGRAVPVPAVLLIVLGGVALPVLGPLSNLLLGLGLLVTAWRGRWGVSGDGA